MYMNHLLLKLYQLHNFDIYRLLNFVLLDNLCKIRFQQLMWFQLDMLYMNHLMLKTYPLDNSYKVHHLSSFDPLDNLYKDHQQVNTTPLDTRHTIPRLP